jgi:hypothetical protein
MREGKKKKKPKLTTLVCLGQGGTKKVHPLVQHPSTLVFWWVVGAS